MIFQWTGLESKALRISMRLTVHGFAERLGIHERVISRWEAGGSRCVPRPFSQQCLDTCLDRASDAAKERFYAFPTLMAEARKRHRGGELRADFFDLPAVKEALGSRDISVLYRLLQRAGISQRRIASLTEQSQSEISEIIRGRKVTNYDVLVRIAAGLKIPRTYMGLAYGPIESGPVDGA